MKRIELGGQPLGKCSWCGGPLERLIDHAKELGFEFVAMGVAEICDVVNSPIIYESPVIYLKHRKRLIRAVISQRKEGRGLVYSLSYYRSSHGE